ncbi:hypothetical protein E3Q17_04290 [Wallemia mellicola]|uniref:Tubby C-terminal domain-containing protein n=3 Tax=Wallemia mellicola TaxID=1708541 RepID=A0A4T0NF16_9BASI|nr:hypothetical protein E3Q17_04290 [Wallemia mellicola]
MIKVRAYMAWLTTMKIDSQGIYTFKRKTLSSSFDVYKGSTLSGAREQGNRPVMNVDISSISSEMLVRELPSMKSIVTARRRRWTGKGYYDVTVGGRTTSLERSSVWSQKRSFKLLNGTSCLANRKSFAHSASFVITNQRTGNTLATFENCSWAMSKHGVLRLHAPELDDDNIAVLFMAIIIMVRLERDRRQAAASGGGGGGGGGGGC